MRLRSANENEEYTLTIESDINAPNLVEGGVPFYLQLTGASSTSTLSQGNNVLNGDAVFPNRYRVILPAGSRSVDIAITSILIGAAVTDTIGMLLLSSPVASEDFYTVSITGQIVAIILTFRDIMPPHPVTNLQLDSVDDTQGDRRITVSWENPTDTDYSHAMVGWRVQGTTSDFVNPIRVNSPGTTATITVPTMDIYEITVWTVDSSGNGDPERIQASINAGGPAILISTSESSVEEGNTVMVSLTLSAAATEELTVPLRVTNGTARLGSDYTIANMFRSLTFNAGEQVKTVPVMIISDNVYEGPETFMIGSSYSTEVTITITDRVPTNPRVSLSVSPGTIAEEGSTSTTLTVTLSKPPTRMVTIPIDTEGTATLGDDYTLTNTPLTFANGTSVLTQTVTITARDDAVDEDDETITLSVDPLNIAGVADGPDTTATITITDNDEPAVPTVSFTTATATVVEEVLPLVIVTVQLSNSPATTLLIPVITEDGTAKAVVDYAPVNAIVEFPAGTNTLTQTVFILIADDKAYEATSEMFTVTFGTLPSGVAAGNVDEVTVTITDTDTAPSDPVVNVSVTPPTITENAVGAASFKVTLSSALATSTEIPITVGGTATQGIDYTLSNTSVTFPTVGGEPATTVQTVTVTIINDSIDELDETIILSVDASGIAGVANGATTRETITITDDDAPELSLSLPDGVSSLEEGSPTTLTIQASTAVLNIDSQGGLPVYLNFGDSSVADESHLDISVASSTVTYASNRYRVIIPTGQSSLEVTLGTLNLTSDVALELELIDDPADPDNYTVNNTANTVSLSLVNDVTPPAAVTGLTARTVGNLQVSVNFTPPTDADYDHAVIGWRIAGGSTLFTDANTMEVSSNDPLPATITVPSGSYDIVVWTVDNRGNGSATTSQVSTTVDVTANPTVSFGAATMTVAEGAGTVEVTVQLSGSPVAEAVIPVTVTGVEATADSDYMLLTSMNLIFNAGSHRWRADPEGYHHHSGR